MYSWLRLRRNIDGYHEYQYHGFHLRVVSDHSIICDVQHDEDDRLNPMSQYDYYQVEPNARRRNYAEVERYAVHLDIDCSLYVATICTLYINTRCDFDPDNRRSLDIDTFCSMYINAVPFIICTFCVMYVDTYCRFRTR